MTRRGIDLNADVGELPERLADGSEARLLQWVTSANIACGGHAGSPESMRALVQLCRRHGVAAGAHPSYPDRANFGRRPVAMEPRALEASLRAQVAALDAIARESDTRLAHVKPHGALYNDAVKDPALARSIAAAVEPWKSSVVLVGLAGSPLLQWWAGLGFRVAAEAFADRRYEPDGTLRSRSLPDAVLHDPDAAAAQALLIASEGRVLAGAGTPVEVHADTLCVHGDTPGAAAIARRVREALARHGIAVRNTGV